MNANYISNDDFTRQNPQIDVSRYNTATISGFISDASRIVDDITNAPYGFDIENITGEKQTTIITNDGDLKIFPKKIPIVSVSSIKIRRSTWEITLSLTSGGSSLLEITDPDNKVIVYPNTFLSAVGTFTINDLRDLRQWETYTVVDYRAGYETIPRPIQQATSLIVRDLLSKNLNQSGAASISQGGISIRYASNNSGDSDFIKDAKSLLHKYKRITG